MLLPQIAVQIYTVLDKTMIGAITNDMIEVGYYEQAQKIVKSAVTVLSALQIVMNSRIANAHSKKDDKEITYFHAFVTALGKVMYNRPRLNRFVANRLYDMIGLDNNEKELFFNCALQTYQN